MKSTGITRHIDELGRIVIPKEIRSNLKIEVNDLLEFYIENNKLILEKTSRLKRINDVMDNYLNVFFQCLKKTIVICDKEKIIGVTKDIGKSFINYILTDNNKKIIFSSSLKGEINLFNKDFFYLKKSIVIEGNVIGQILFLQEKDSFTENDTNLLAILTNLFITYLNEM